MIRLRCRFPFEPWRCSCCGKRIEGRAPSSVNAGLACDACLDLGRRGEPFIPLTVRMVAPKQKIEQRQFVAVCMRDERCLSETGELFDLAGLVERIRERKHGELGRRGPLRADLPDRLPACFIVTDNGLDLQGYLDHSAAADSPLWNWQMALRAPSAWRPEAKSKSKAQFLEPKPVRFGYASRGPDEKRSSKGRACWWEVIDVHQFCELPNGWGAPDVAELLRFGLELREWANLNRLPVLASASAYGSRLLRDARFGGGWRRKVPSGTNAALRSKLPGNHYQLLTAADKSLPEVHKLDQQAAHHHAALANRFPHPDLLRADGWFRRHPLREGTKAQGAGAIGAFTDRWYELTSRPGIFTLAIHVKERLAIDSLQIPALRQAGTHWRTVTSVELAHLKRLEGNGVGLGDIWACWTSPEVDERLNELALWSLGQLEGIDQRRKGWMKPALLAAYGMLAVKPRKFRNVWRWVTRPDGAMGFQTRYGQLIGYERAGKTERESQTANVLWRALIESSVRLESLTFAQQLRVQGFRPVAVYADAVFVTGDGEPPAPAPWRYEGLIHNLTFETPSRYRSREETRLPGSPRFRGGELRRALPTPTTTGGQ